MCTAVRINALCGRTLDLELSYEEKVIVTPRGYPFVFRHVGAANSRYAMLGVGIVRDGLPLYYDAVNEKGVFIAGLNFPESAHYSPKKEGYLNLASYEVIPWLLGHCETVSEAVAQLEKCNITPDSFRKDLPASPLHFFLADKTRALAVEPLLQGLTVSENPFDVLANEPPFPFHKTNLAKFMALSPKPPNNTLCPKESLPHFSRGMGALGLPGDFSSPSRFVRSVFMKNHTLLAQGDPDGINRFFHVMDTVSLPLGSVLTREGKAVSTIYTSCADTEKGVYYLTTYENRRIRAFSFTQDNKQAGSLTVISAESREDIHFCEN